MKKAMNESELVVLMGRKAKEAGMLEEVWDAFETYLERGDTIATAVPCALWDFDIDLAG